MRTATVRQNKPIVDPIYAGRLLNTPLDAIDKLMAERHLSDFVKQMWVTMDPHDYVHGWHIDAICEHAEAVINLEILRLIVNVPPRHMKSLSLSVGLCPWAWIKKPELQFVYFSYASTLSIRDGVKARRVLESPKYQQWWGDKYLLTSDQNTKIRYDNDKGGYRICTSVSGVATGEGGDVLVIDDANNVQEAESEVVRTGTNVWFDEVIQSRFNDPKTGALISIQQRSNAKDLTGHIMSKYGNDYTYLILPCKFEVESRRKNSLRTFHGFTDPRKKDGELLWPERFGPDEIAALEKGLGPFGCTPYESPILMADLSTKPIGEIKIGDKIIGFGKKEPFEGDTRSHRRVHLMESEVKRVFVYHDQPIVKLNLDSGKSVRCTPDHKWYKKHREEYGGLWYGPAGVGSKLCRVCEPEIRKLNEDEVRMAGWVGGFFDGDGSVSNCRRGDEFRTTCQIKFYQGAGRNKPICDKLEDYLTRLGFTFTYSCDTRKDPKKGVNFEYRAYSLTGFNLDTNQRFLHHIQPTKWRDRLLLGSLGTKWIKQREKVVSIRKQRNETVYALETTTGNYVVWGLASSNSAGQLQQRPAPREGGIIPIDKFQRYNVIPAKETWIRISLSFDTALKEAELNAYSVGQVWVETSRGLFLLYIWRKKCRYPELKRMAKMLCEEWQPHEVLIEDKSTGSVLIQDLQEEKKYPVKAIDPGGFDKVMRMEAEATAIESGLCWIPETIAVEVDSGISVKKCTWLPDFETECADFPNGEYKDQIDPMSQFLKTVRVRRQKKVPLVSPVFMDFNTTSHWRS